MVQHKQHHIQQQQQEDTVACCFAERGWWESTQDSKSRTVIWLAWAEHPGFFSKASSSQDAIVGWNVHGADAGGGIQNIVRLAWC